MIYAETIAYLYERLPMFTRIGAAAYKKDLHNTLALCEAFGNPQNKFKSIHVAGTNGKGSTSHLLAAVFHASGYKTGLYTSPHLKDFRERIKISDGENLAFIEEDFVVELVQKAKPFIEEINPSFFEVTVAMAFEYFAQQNVDIAIVETGLGGRLDSTNIILPELSIITNIGYDHMNILGNTLPEIAMEKAGIIKPNIPVIIGETLPETKPIFLQKALQENSPIFFSEEMYQIKSVQTFPEKIMVELYDTEHKVAANFEVGLAGIYQQKNMQTVATSIKTLMPNWSKINHQTITNGLANVKKITGLHGRWELIETNPTVILDVGHNEDGMKQILAQINSIQSKKTTNIHIIIGMVKDKEVEKVLQLLPTNFNYYFTNAHLPRALPALDLKAIASSFNLQGNTFENVNDALAAAKSSAKKTDLIVVCGSVFLVGEVNEQ